MWQIVCCVLPVFYRIAIICIVIYHNYMCRNHTLCMAKGVCIVCVLYKMHKISFKTGTKPV